VVAAAEAMSMQQDEPMMWRAELETMLDLVMWTLNGEETLEESLSSIEKSVPEDQICHRFIIDGGSIDATTLVARQHGWSVLPGPRGIARQGNLALSLVDTAVYASFEQDIIISANWFQKVSRLISEPGVAVAQGIRVAKGSATLAAMDRENLLRTMRWGPSVSIDNTMYKTNVVRDVGGYRAFKERKGTDALLHEKIHAAGYKWAIDTTCISGHLRPSLAYHLRHCLRSYQLVLWQHESTGDHLRLCATSLVRGGMMASKYHDPQVFLGYPLFRWVALLGGLSGRV